MVFLEILNKSCHCLRALAFCHKDGPPFLQINKERDIVMAFRLGGFIDPQLFHTDPEVAEQSIFGGLIASGWYSAGLMMRLYVDHYLSHIASLSSPGVDELRWLKPLRPGDSISIRITVTDTKRSSSKPDRGIVHSYIEVRNQHREIIMSMKATNFLACREMP